MKRYLRARARSREVARRIPSTRGPRRSEIPGARPLQLVFEFAAGQSPPVTLSTTYVDDRVRLALAAKGGRLIFTRGGLAAEPIAEGWKSVLEAKPVGGRSAAAGLLVALASTAALVPAARRPIKFVALVALTLAALRAADGVRRRLIAA